HESLTSGSLSFASSGNFVLTEIEFSQVAGDDDQTSAPILIDSAEATFQQGGHSVTQAFDGKPKTGWAVYEGRVVDREHAAIFRFADPVDVVQGQMLRIVLRHDSPHQRHNLGRFRISVSDSSEPKLTDGDSDLLVALSTPKDSRSETQRKAIGRAYRLSIPEYRKLQNKRDSLVKKRDAITKQLPKVMVMADMPQPRDTFILDRGLYNKPTKPVVAKLPKFLPSPAVTDVEKDSSSADAEVAAANSGAELSRLDLARWLVDPRHPLTARVTVNRFWQQLFGIGLVKTTEDFGAQGETPEHLELLDWLAKRFQEDGWDVKALLKLIVTSHTYRQSSKIQSPEHYATDPKNRLLSRSPRYRLPSWMLRDQALKISGLLSPSSGGPAVNTYQPPGVWEEASFGKKAYQQDVGEKLYRRSLYTYWRRIIAPTMFFDNATRQTCTVKSGRTNTPLHALQTLNNTAYVEAARALATSVLQSHRGETHSNAERVQAKHSDAEHSDAEHSDAERIDAVMRQALGRDASPRERDVLRKGLQRNREQLQGRRPDAVELLSVGETPWDETFDPIELAAWSNLCLAVLNLDETLNRE
ncbi:MAG: DUF1553 domain-containing protein, partial [Rubripirellula sp.]